MKSLSRVLDLETLGPGNAKLYQARILLAGCGAGLEVVAADKTIGGMILPRVGKQEER